MLKERFGIKMESLQCENLNDPLCRKVSFSSEPHCQFLGVRHAMLQT